MRKFKSIAVVTALVLVAIIATTGCSCSKENTKENTTKVEEPAKSQNSGSQSSETQKRVENVENVDYKDYINGKNFDLDGFTEALGYKKIADPEEGGILYAIEAKDGTKCFFCFSNKLMFVWLDKRDGFTYQTDPLAVAGGESDFMIDTGSGEGPKAANEAAINDMSKVLKFLATTNTVEVNYMPVFKSMIKVSGSPKYFPNGAIIVEGSFIESSTIRNP